MFRHTSELPAPLVGSEHELFMSPGRLEKTNLHEANRQEAPIQRGHYLLAEVIKAGRIDEMTKIVSSGEYSLDELVYITQTMPPAIKQFGKLIGIKVKAKPSITRKQLKPRKPHGQRKVGGVDVNEIPKLQQTISDLAASLEELSQQVAQQQKVIDDLRYSSNSVLMHHAGQIQSELTPHQYSISFTAADSTLSQLAKESLGLDSAQTEQAEKELSFPFGKDSFAKNFENTASKAWHLFWLLSFPGKSLGRLEERI